MFVKLKQKLDGYELGKEYLAGDLGDGYYIVNRETSWGEDNWNYELKDYFIVSPDKFKVNDVVHVKKTDYDGLGTIIKGRNHNEFYTIAIKNRVDRFCKQEELSFGT